MSLFTLRYYDCERAWLCDKLLFFIAAFDGTRCYILLINFFPNKREGNLSTNVDLMSDVEMGTGGQENRGGRMRREGGDLSSVGHLGQRLAPANHILVNVVGHARRVLKMVGHDDEYYLLTRLIQN